MMLRAGRAGLPVLPPARLAGGVAGREHAPGRGVAQAKI
jgi:hypothetical protein